MTTTEANPHTSRLAAMRASLSGVEWARVAAGVDLRRGAGRGGFSAVVESYLHRGKRAHDGVLTNRILVRVSRPGRAVLTEPLVPNKGKVVPRGPGLGLEWDEKGVHKYAFE
jgi:L-alanine-DL-glutamate epimerase-like enolase superfamily enzyme